LGGLGILIAGGRAYFSITIFDGLNLDVIDPDHLAVEAHDSHDNSDKAVLPLELLLVIFHAVAKSQVAVKAFEFQILAILFLL